MKVKEEILERIDSFTEKGDLECYMIVCNAGVSVHGDTSELLTLLTALQKRLIELGVDKELVEKTMKLAVMDDKEILKELKDKLIKMCEELGDE